jgi:uncharacterized RDD family membrane protein YckC
VNEKEKYIRDVLRYTYASPQERARIEADLQAHLDEALENLPPGESVTTVIARMGSPEEVAAEFMAGVTLRYASFWRRLAAFVIDMALCIVVVFPITVLAVVLSNQVPERDPQGTELVLAGVLLAIVFGIGFAVVGLFVFYFPILEGRFGRTVGKRLLGLRVIKEIGTPVGFKEAFLRRLSFYFDFFALDALFILFTARRQRALDIIARTVVIREPK